jgi:hypothetical protein
MPVNVVDVGPPTTLAAGKSVTEEYWFGDQQDVGVCFASIATEPQFKARLVQSDQGRVGYQMLIGGVWHPGSTAWNYTVTTRNLENYSVAFNLRIAILKNG